MMSQPIPSSTGATAPVLTPRKRGVTPLPFLFSLLLFVPRCGYATNNCIDTALEEGLWQLGCTHQGCTIQGALQVMLPLLHEHDVRRLTLEAGVVAKDKKPFQLMVGCSFRHAFSAEGFWGVNGVLDASDKESGTQLSVGIEGYLSSFFSSLSYYFPLGTIQEASVQTPPKKQLAKSIEARLFYRFPSVKSIRTGIVAEQLVGDAIELPGTEKKQKNPRRGSLQIEYQPMSLVTFHLGYQLQSGSSRRHQVVAGLGLTFRFNQLLAEQTKSVMQKKVLLTGDGAYELIARRQDRAVDHGTVPKAAIPVVVLATQRPGKTTVQGPAVTVSEKDGGANGAKVVATRGKGKTIRNVNPVNLRSNASQVQWEAQQCKLPKVKGVKKEKEIRRVYENLQDAAQGACVGPEVVSELLKEQHTAEGNASDSPVPEEVGEMNSSASIQYEKQWKKDEPLRRDVAKQQQADAAALGIDDYW